MNVWNSFVEPAFCFWRRNSESAGKDGWTVVRSKGDHVMLTKPGELANISVPQHRELKRPTLKQILIHAGLSSEEFKNLL